MKTKPDSKNSDTNAATLRKKAEELLKEKLAKTKSKLSEIEMQKLIHELQVHQIELELQNKELRLAKKQAEKEQSESSEERFKLLYENAKIGLYRTSPDGTILLANKALITMLGYPSFNEIAKRNINKDGFESPDHRKAFLEKIEQTGEIDNFESTWVRKDRTPVFVRESARAIRDTNGNTLYYDGTVEDITERKQAKEAHLTNEKRLHEFNVLQGLLLQPNPIEKKLKLITDAVVRTMSADFARIWMIKPGDRCQSDCIHAQVTEGPHVCRFRDRCLHLMASSGSYTHTNGKVHARVPFGCYKIGEVAAAEAPKFLTNEVTTDPRVHNNAWAKELGLVSFAGYRLVDANDIPLGVLALFSKQVISAEDDLFLERIARATSRVLYSAWVEEALRDSEARYRLLFEINADGILIVDVETKTLKYANPALCRMLGYSEHELTTLGLADIHPKQDFQHVIAEFESLSRGDKTLTPDIPCLRKDGSIVYADINSTNITINGRQHAVGIFRDITGRKLVDDKLRNSEERLKILFEYAPDAYYLNDLKGNVIDGNIAAQKLLGYDKKDLIGKSFLKLNLLSPNQIVKAVKLLAKNIMGQSTGPDEFVINRKDGSKVTVEISTHPVKIKKQTVVLGIARNITERKLVEEALKRSEEQLKEAQSVGLIGSWELDPVKNTGSMSDEMYKIFDINVNSTDITIESFLETPIPEDRKMVQELVMKSLEERKGVEFDFRIVASNGEIHWIHERSTVEVDDKGNPKRIFGTCQDITERKLFELQLKESEEQFRSMFENNSAAMILAEPDTTVSMVNDEYCKLSGYSKQEIIGSSWTVHIPPEDLERLKEYNRKRLTNANDVPDKYEFTIYNKKGEIRHVLMSVTLLRNKKTLASFIDITELKYAETTLRESEEKYRALFETSLDGISLLDLNGKIVSANKQAVKLFGYDQFSEFIGLDGFGLIHPEEKPQMDIYFEEFIAKGFITNCVVRSVKKDGTEFIGEYSATIIKNSNGDPIYLMDVVRDVTENKRVEEALLRINKAVESSGEAICMSDPQGHHFYHNKAFTEFFGYTVEEIQAADRGTIVYANKDVGRMVFEIIMGGGTWNGEVEMRSKSGRKLTVLLRADSIKDENGTIVGLVGIHTDITERKRAEKALIDSETRAHALIDAIPDLIFRLDKQGVYLEYKAAKEDLAFQSESIIGKKNRDIMPPEFADLVDEKIRLTLQTGQMQLFEYQLSVPNKGINEFEARMVPGSSDEVIAIVRNVTERKKTEEKINMLALAVENSADCIAVTDKNYKIIFVNDSFCQVYGFDKEEIVGQPISVLTSENNLPEVGHALYSAIAKNEMWTGEVINRRKDGNDFPVQLSLAPVNTDKGELIAIVGVLRDITERKQAEEALRHSEQRYRLLIETANEGILVAQNGFHKFINPKMQEITGYSKEELLIIPFIDHVYPDDLELVRSNHQKRLNGDSDVPRYQYRFVKKDGCIRWIEMNGIKIEWEGQPATLNLLTDITERVQAEEEIRLKNEQLLKLNAEKDKFFSIIAHDLRGPLGGLMGLTEMMTDDSQNITPDQNKELTLGLSHSARNIFNLLENLLEWSQMQSGYTEVRPQALSLKEVLNESLKVVNDSAINKDIEIAVEVVGECIIFADINMLQTVIRNLVSNAIKFTQKGGKVTISAKPEGNNTVRIAIKDTGIGMSGEMLDNLFSIAAKNNRPGTEGESSSGLGLLLCKEIIERHGGEIRAESEEGKGSAFYFTLPYNAG